MLSSQQEQGLITWWRHQMETFFTLLAFCAGNSLVTSEFPSQRPVMQSFDVSLICTLTNSWANNQDASDLRCHCTHYDFTVMIHVIEILSLDVRKPHHDYQCPRGTPALSQPIRTQPKIYWTDRHVIYCIKIASACLFVPDIRFPQDLQWQVC